jgi:hypothetical protein
MTIAEVLSELQKKLTAPGPSRRFYVVTGTYPLLAEFKSKLIEKQKRKVKPFNGLKLVSLNDDLINYMETLGILDKVIESERDEKYDSVRKRLKEALENLLTSELKTSNTICISDLELSYGYGLSLTFLWNWAVNEKQIIILVPGEKKAKEVIAFPWNEKTRQTFPNNLVKDEWTWEITE